MKVIDHEAEFSISQLDLFKCCRLASLDILLMGTRVVTGAHNTNY